MSKCLFIALTNVSTIEGEAAFNRWYDEILAPAMMKVPGFRSVKRYRASSIQPQEEAAPYRYLAIYEIESSAKAISSMMAVAKELPDSPLLDRNLITIAFEEIFHYPNE